MIWLKNCSFGIKHQSLTVSAVQCRDVFSTTIGNIAVTVKIEKIQHQEVSTCTGFSRTFKIGYRFMSFHLIISNLVIMFNAHIPFRLKRKSTSTCWSSQYKTDTIISSKKLPVLAAGKLKNCLLDIKQQSLTLKSWSAAQIF